MTEKIIKDITERFGCAVYLYYDDGAVVKGSAFIQPLRYKNKVYIDGECISLGEIKGGYYLLIASPELELDEDGEYVIYCPAMKGRFSLRSCGVYCLENKPLYTWAVLEKSAGEVSLNGV